MEGFLLGLSNGTVCLAHCAPVIVPYFLSEKREISGNIGKLLFFLCGRLIGYLFFAVLAWIFGNFLYKFPIISNFLLGITFILLAICLGYSGISSSKLKCAFTFVNNNSYAFFAENNWLVTVILGILTGVNVCPPFLLAFSSTASNGSLAYSILYFFMFYLGSTIYFFPVIFISTFSRKNCFQTIGRMSSIIMSIYFLVKGIVMLIAL